MKRRDFLMSSAGLAGVVLPAIGHAQTKPCPPPSVGVAGGSTTQSNCAVGSAEADWLARSTADGVVAAYDFSKPPANGGDWIWGSLAPGVTCLAYRQSDYPTARVVDTGIAPPGSTASLRFDLPQGTSERSDNWLISIDDYTKQFGAGDEFWVQWRQRLNPTMATFDFIQSGGGATTLKQLMISEGMQDPHPYSTARAHRGYEGPGTNSNNTLNDLRFCSENQIVMVARAGNTSPQIKYPQMYHGCQFYVNFQTYNGSGYTDRNDGNESNPTSCVYSGGSGVVGNPSTCFTYMPGDWLTLMVRVVCGPQGTAMSSLGGGSQSGFINSTIEYYGGYPGRPVQLLHRKTGIVLRRGNSPGEPGWSPLQKFGLFSWTTFMTLKSSTQTHPLAQTWMSQMIISRKRIADPAF